MGSIDPSPAVPTSDVDVLIIGAGPAGLMLTTWLSRLGIRTRIVDKRGTKIFNGQADGLQCRTLEIFDSLGFVDRAWRESNHMLEICLWNPGNTVFGSEGDEAGKYRGIERSDRIPDTIPGISRFQQVVLHQGRIERFMLDSIKEESLRTGCNGEGAAGEVKVEHGVLPTELTVREEKLQDLGEYPVEVRLRHLTEEEATPKQKATSVNGKGVMDGLFRSNLASDDNEALVRGKGVLQEKAGREEVVRAKFLVGADGAHSWVRRELGPSFALKGDSTDFRHSALDSGPVLDDTLLTCFTVSFCSRDDCLTLNWFAICCQFQKDSQESSLIMFTIWPPTILRFRQLTMTTVWGVLDIIPRTDFPDIRMRCAIHSESHGSVMVIPRENKLVRLYIQLTTTNVDGSCGKRVDRSTITPETIIASAQRIMRPYKIGYKYLDWWTAYQIGQRVGDRFSLDERVFLMGDAVHTHSPKAGQGMNVSMQDAFNLGWKLAGCVKGRWGREVLETYEQERRQIARDLIDFDHRFSRLFSGRPAKDVMDEEGISMEAFKDAFEKGNLFASGIAVDYCASPVVAKGDKQAVRSQQDRAKGIKVGMRMPSFKVLNQADARPWHMQEVLKSNGSWRVIVFPGDIRKEDLKKRLDVLGEKLAAKDSFLKRFAKSSDRYDSVIEVLSVHAAPRTDVTVFDFPEAFRQWDENDGWDYWKIHVDDQSYHEGHGQAYHNYEIDPSIGAAVILRPDQYVSWVGDFDDYESMDKFFTGFMLEQQPSLSDAIPEAESIRLEYGGKKAEAMVAGVEAAAGVAAM